MPTGPGEVALANPRPRPPTTAVPQSGPMTRRPRAVAVVLSATSWSMGTLSLKTMTSWPASSASIASTNALAPGHGHEDEGVAAAAQRGGGGAVRRDLGAPGVAAGAGREGALDGGEPGVERPAVLEPERDDQVVRRGLGRDGEAHLGEYLDVERGGHGDLGRGHAGGVLHAAADLEQGHRVGVRAAAQLDVGLRCGGHAARAPSVSSWSSARRAPARSPAPDVAPTRVSSVGAVVLRGRAERGQPGAQLGQHLAVQGAVQQGRGEQRGPAAGAPGPPGRRSGVGTPAARWRASQPHRTSSPSGVRPSPRADQPGHGVRVDGWRWSGSRRPAEDRSRGQSWGADVHGSADRQWPAVEVEDPARNVRRKQRKVTRGPGAATGARTGPGRPPRPPGRRTGRRPRRTRRAARDGRSAPARREPTGAGRGPAAGRSRAADPPVAGGMTAPSCFPTLVGAG